MPILPLIQSSLPEDWTLSNLINLSPGWQANICDGEYVIVATGDTIEDALANAANKTLDSRNYLGRLFSLPRIDDTPPKVDLSVLLGLAKPKGPPLRRLT